MPTVQGTLSDAGIVDVAGAQVTVQLVASTSDPNAAGYVSSANLEIFSPKTATTNVTGDWSVTLTANSLVIPAGTRYKVTYLAGPTRTSQHIIVPDAAGPFWVGDILASPPLSIGNAFQPQSILPLVFQLISPLTAPFDGESVRRIFGNGWNIEAMGVDLTDPLPSYASPLTIDVRVNGTSIWTDSAHLLTLTTGMTEVVTTQIDLPTLGDGDKMTVHLVAGILDFDATVAGFATNLTLAGTSSAGAGGATVVVQQGDVTAAVAADTFDFLAGDFQVIESPAGEANIELDPTVARSADVVAAVAGEATARDVAVEAHRTSTIGVHGIADTSALLDQTSLDDAIATHNADTTAVHDIADTSLLVTIDDLGSYVSYYVHSQASLATEWTIVHNLGRKPAITLLDTSSEEFFADIIHDSTSQARAVMAVAMNGSAYCV